MFDYTLEYVKKFYKKNPCAFGTGTIRPAIYALPFQKLVGCPGRPLTCWKLIIYKSRMRKQERTVVFVTNYTCIVVYFNVYKLATTRVKSAILTCVVDWYKMLSITLSTMSSKDVRIFPLCQTYFKPRQQHRQKRKIQKRRVSKTR